jgi:hypothetical protein
MPPHSQVLSMFLRFCTSMRLLLRFCTPSRDLRYPHTCICFMLSVLGNTSRPPGLSRNFTFLVLAFSLPTGWSGGQEPPGLNAATCNRPAQSTINYVQYDRGAIGVYLGYGLGITGVWVLYVYQPLSPRS